MTANGSIWAILDFGCLWSSSVKSDIRFPYWSHFLRQVQQWEHSIERLLVWSLHCWMNDSQCLLNKKWLHLKCIHWLEIKAKHLSTCSLNCFNSYIHKKETNSSFQKCAHSPSPKPIVIMVAILEFWAKHLSSWIMSTCKPLGECLGSCESAR